MDNLHRGSRDDDPPEEIDLPGIDAKLTEPQRKAVKALKKFFDVKTSNKEAKKQMKDAEDKAAREAFAALDAIKAEAGNLGPATFFTEWKRKLKVEIDERRRAPEGNAT
jgi:hypothetical protein